MIIVFFTFQIQEITWEINFSKEHVQNSIIKPYLP